MDPLQIWSVVAFSKWLHPATGEPLEAALVTKSAGQLCKDLLSEADSRRSKRYKAMKLPEYSPLLKKVESVLQESCQELSSNDPPLPVNAWRLQQALLIGLQVLMPPLRGKTYWDLRTSETETGSM